NLSLKEEKVYYIDSFIVRAANRTYRPVANNLMILFSKWTTLEEHINVPPHFTGITFSLTPFEDVPSLVEKNSFYVDIMGVITEVGADTTIRPKSRNAESLKRTLQIRDYNASQTQAQVVVFVGTLMKDYSGLGLTLTGSSPCKWYINLNIPKVAELNESFSTNFQPIKWVDEPATGYNQDVLEEKSIAEILNIYPHKHKGTRFIVNVTVRRICNEYSWYKVVLIVGDDANATFILFGRIAQRLLRRPIESLIEENPPNSEYIPSEITSLIGSNFAWNVSFTRDTVTMSQECLQVNSIISSGASPATTPYVPKC
uniref:Replication protein A OB domain-containing protein n=1 Tax=Oryza glaberrima TaxID=4538 RepID=I1PTC2_ORYGL